MALTNAQKQAAHRSREKAKVARMREALEMIANNMTRDQVMAEYGDGDFEGAYDAFVSIARNALR